jgi:HPt (histidine-containing phosphotransfer) domain-containing protein
MNLIVIVILLVIASGLACGSAAPNFSLGATFLLSMKSFLTAKRNALRWLTPRLVGSFVLLLTACGPKQADLAAASQLEQELQQLRASNQELQRLRAENQELPRLRRDNEELRRLRDQTKDLTRLREENDQLRGQLQALKAPKPKP